MEEKKPLEISNAEFNHAIKTVWQRVIHSAVTAYVVMLLFVAFGQYRIHQTDQRDIQRTCAATVSDWNTFQHLINAATHPPSQAGKRLTAAQEIALNNYHNELVNSIGPKPHC